MRIVSIALPFFLATILSGCAVLKVDVDIYKGPLSNSSEVQTEQMYAMAIAAQPMLQRLKETQGLTSAQINTIQSVLSLYKDRVPKELSDFMEKINSISDAYESAIYRFDHERYESWWKSNRPDKSTESNKTLAKGYDNYFSDESKWQWKRLIIDGTNEKDNLLLQGWNSSVPPENDANKIDTNEAFKALRDPVVVKLHADQLFSGEENAVIRNEFIAKVTAKAGAYWNARTELHNLLMAALEGLAEKKNDNSNKTMLEDYPQTRKATAKLAASLIRYGFLKNVACKAPKVGELAKDWKVNRDNISKKLLEDCADVAAELKKADFCLMEGDYCQDAKDKTKQPFGLAIGPDFNSDNLLSPNDLLATIREDITAFNSSANLLQRGRSRDGINSLVEKYLRLRDKATSLDQVEETRIQEKRLANALVAFAEKVLFLANNEFFLTPGNGANQSFSSNGESSSAQTANDSDVIKQYIQVLQAVGNSIITLADDYKQLQDFERNQKDKWSIELTAVKQVFAKDGAAVLHAVIMELQAERNSSLTDKTAEVIGDLRKVKLDKVKTELDSFEKTLAAALKSRTEENITLLKAVVKKLQVKLDNENDSTEKNRFKEQLKTWLDTNNETFALNTTVEVLKGKEQWAKELGRTAVNSTAFIDEIIARLDSEKGGAADDVKLVARQVLSKRKFTVSSIGEMDNARKDPRQVIDQLSAQLRYMLLAETKSSGTNTQVGKNLASALKLLSSYRSEMTYLRSAGVYLRNSYPTTTLQPSSEVSWDNLLGQQMGRAWMPFYSSISDPDKKAKAEIDKQFWQNINSVRVAGAGSTNYVITKDDIGNWYVKAYSADPRQIIESAKGLAMFSLAPQVAGALPAAKTAGKQLANAAQENSSQELTDSIKQEPQPGIAEKMMQSLQVKYIEQLTDERKELAQLIKPEDEKLAFSIKTAWATDDTTKDLGKKCEAFFASYKSELSRTYDALAVETVITAQNLAEFRSKYLEALSSLRRLGVAFRNTIPQWDKDDKDIAISPQTRNRAMKLSTEVFREKLNGFIVNRQSRIDGYKSTLGVLNENISEL